MTVSEIIYWCVLLILPVALIVCGIIQLIAPPKKINKKHGFRTPEAQTSQEAWDDAQKFYGIFSLIAGFILTAGAVAVKLWILPNMTDTDAEHSVLIRFVAVTILIIFAGIYFINRAVMKKYGIEKVIEKR